MKVYFWDFHGTLEEGSQQTLIAAINGTRLRYGMFPDAGEDELVSYFGPPLPSILSKYFPRQDMWHVTRTVRELAIGYTEQMMRPMKGAIKTLERIKKGGNMNYIVSTADGYDLATQVDILGFRPYVDGMFTFLLDGEQNGNGPEEFKAGTIVNQGLMAMQRHYSVTPEKILLIGDTRTDMLSADMAKQMVIDSPGLRRQFGDVKIIGCLFDPDGSKTEIAADHRLRELADVLKI